MALGAVNVGSTGSIGQTEMDGRYLRLTGGTLTGLLTLAARDPAADYHAAHKLYVDKTVNTTVHTAIGNINTILDNINGEVI